MYRILLNTVYDLNNIDTSGTYFKDSNLFSSEVSEVVNTLNELCIMSGNPNGYFDPKGKLTRVQLANILRNKAK